MIFVGVGLILISLFSKTNSFWVALIYGIPILILGIIILLNKREDKIEKRKDKIREEKVIPKVSHSSIFLDEANINERR